MFAAAFSLAAPLSLKAGHIYSASFTEGPTPATENRCTAYKVAADTDYLRVTTRFSASAGGAVWAHDSLIFTVTGTLGENETASLKFTNVTATLAPFMLRISAPGVGPADSLTFNAADDTACPSEHCLLPNVTTSLPSRISTPKCGFATIGASVYQPISPDAPAGLPLLVDITSLVRKGARALKVAVVPEQKTQDGFWASELQLSGAHVQLIKA